MHQLFSITWQEFAFPTGNFCVASSGTKGQVAEHGVPSGLRRPVDETKVALDLTSPRRHEIKDFHYDLENHNSKHAKLPGVKTHLIILVQDFSSQDGSTRGSKVSSYCMWLQMTVLTHFTAIYKGLFSSICSRGLQGVISSQLSCLIGFFEVMDSLPVGQMAPRCTGRQRQFPHNVSAFSIRSRHSGSAFYISGCRTTSKAFFSVHFALIKICLGSTRTRCSEYFGEEVAVLVQSSV